MSDDALYKTMLYFDGHRPGSFLRVDAGDGIDVRISLPRMLPLDALPKNITEMHVYPEMHDFRLREGASRVRDMEPPEVTAIRGVFASIADCARRMLGLDGFQGHE